MNPPSHKECALSTWGVTPRHLFNTQGEHHVQKLITLQRDAIKKNLLQNIHDYFDIYSILQCNLDHIAVSHKMG